ncbi:MAG TPA: nucleoside-diphosphate kinase [Thermomicrobiales bacterium]|jgi:nucleoside-diphosphate kinase|nr:nucleoside-diphosphate kinase [Thermomicrobiales bacterium]
MADVQRTLIIAKPDAVQRGLTGTVISRLESRGLKLVALKFRVIDESISSRHYAEHQGKGFYAGLVEYIGSGPSAIAVFEGPDAIAAARATIGSTNPVAAGSGTIRGDYGLQVGRNLVHGSDSPESAAREIELFFDVSELVDYSRDIERWIVE